MINKRYSRRDFLKIAAAFGGASLFAGCDLLGHQADIPEYIQGAPGVDPLESLEGVNRVFTVCDLCPGACGISCRISQGGLVKIEGSPYHPVTNGEPLPLDYPSKGAIGESGQICAIGGSGIQTLYDPFRIVSPLKRVGPRGSGKWAPIKWGQAYTEIINGGDLFGEGNVQGLKALKEEDNGLGILTGAIDWSAEVFLSRFIKAIGAKSYRDNHTVVNNVADKAARAVFGPDCGPIEADYKQAKFVMTIGDAPLDSGIPLVGKARQIIDSRMKPNGFFWAVIDPRLSTTASKSDLWIPVIPGGDLFLALGIMAALKDIQETADASSNGLRDIPLEKISKSVDIYSCSAKSGVPVEKIQLLADKLFNAGPSAAVIPGPGIYGQPNGLETAMAILWLNRLVGSKPGSGGLISRNSALFAEAEKALEENSDIISEAGAIYSPPEALMVWRSDPAYYEPTKSKDLFGKNSPSKLIITIDQRISQTGALSDYILPDTTYLERWDICRIPGFLGKDGFSVRKPVVGTMDSMNRLYYPIVAGAKIMEDIFLEIGGKIGLDGFDIPKKKKDRITAKSLFDKKLLAMTNAYNALRPLGATERPAAVIEQKGVVFRQSDSSPLVSFDPDLPSFSAEFASSAKPEKELTLITYTLPFHRSPYSGINSWLLEIIPTNRAMINPKDAMAKGIKQGDPIELKAWGSSFSFSCKAQIAPGIKPGVIAIAAGFGYQQYGAQSQSIDGRQLTPDHPRGAGVNPSEFSGKPVLVKRISSLYSGRS